MAAVLNITNWISWLKEGSSLNFRLFKWNGIWIFCVFADKDEVQNSRSLAERNQRRTLSLKCREPNLFAIREEKLAYWLSVGFQYFNFMLNEDLETKSKQRDRSIVGPLTHFAAEMYQLPPCDFVKSTSLLTFLSVLVMVLSDAVRRQMERIERLWKYRIGFIQSFLSWFSKRLQKTNAFCLIKNCVWNMPGDNIY